MAYTRTGRPPGRPKTKEYVTLMARVPQDLADQAKRYAQLHQQTISEVLRGALESLVEEDRYRPFMSDMNTLSEIVSDTNGTQERISTMVHSPAEPEILSDMNGEQEIVSDTNITPAAERSSQPVHTQVSPTPSILDAKALEELPRAPVAIAQQSAPPTLDYDRTKFTLGKLCPRGHAYQGTGQTLLTIGKRRCLPCEAAKKREKRQVGA